MLADPVRHPAAVLLALERVLASPEMVRSPQLAKFLSYIVRRTLGGEEQAIKAYSIAVDVFGRPADFDPQSDPIVRVQARRLRALLNSYYATHGDTEPVQIRLPTGRYIPEFVIKETSTEDSAPAPLSPRHAIAWWMIALPLALILSLMGIGLVRWLQADAQNGVIRARPSITIMEFARRAQTGTPRVSGLAIELVTDLEEFENLDVRYGGTDEVDTVAESDFVLNGAMHTDGDVVHYTASLTDTATASTVWNQTISVRQAEASRAAILDEVSRSFSLVLGSPSGPLHAPARARALAGEETETPPTIYSCRILFELYREAEVSAERVEHCLGQLLEADRSQAVPIAMRASLAAENIHAGTSDEARGQIIDKALADLERALRVRPASSFVWEQRARLQEQRGDISMARSNYSSALQLNPVNTSALAGVARLLVFTGWQAEARVPAAEAVAGASEPPAWYQGAPAALALLDGDYGRAREWAERYALADPEIGLPLALAAAQAEGNSAAVDRFLPQLRELPALRENGILPRLRLRITNAELLNRIADGLVATGLPRSALEQPF